MVKSCKHFFTLYVELLLYEFYQGTDHIIWTLFRTIADLVVWHFSG